MSWLKEILLPTSVLHPSSSMPTRVQGRIQPVKRTRQDAPKLIDVTGSVGKWTRAGGDPPNLQECQSATQRQEQMFQEAKDNVRKTARTQKTAWREEELPQKLKVKVEEVSEGKESENGEDVSEGKESKNGFPEKTQGERKSSDRSSVSRLRKRLTSSHTDRLWFVGER